MGKGYIHDYSAGRKHPSAQRGKDFRPVFPNRARRRLSVSQGPQESDDERTALIASGSLASDHMRLLWTGGGRGIAHLRSENDYELGLHHGRVRVHCQFAHKEIFFCARKANDIKRLLLDQWTSSSCRASARDVLSVAGTLWNLTYVVRAGRYFARTLLRLTRLHDASDRKHSKRMVEVGREFHSDLFFWKWAIDHELLPE